MNEYQVKFFEALAEIQKMRVEVCMVQNNCADEKIRSMLYDCTYGVMTDIMVMLDGYNSSFSNNSLDIINPLTGERLKENPFIELHDKTEGFLRTD